MNKIEVTFMYYKFTFDNLEEAKQLYDLLEKSYDWNKENHYDVLLLTVSKTREDKDNDE